MQTCSYYAESCFKIIQSLPNVEVACSQNVGSVEVACSQNVEVAWGQNVGSIRIESRQ